MEAEREAEKLKEAKGGDEGGMSAGCIGIWKYPFCRSSFEKKLRTSYPGGEISNCGQRISVCNSGIVEATEITAGSPGTIRFRYYVERTEPQRRGMSNNPCFLHLEKLCLGVG